MRTVTTVAELRARIKAWRMQDEAVALVPTMGNLHAGHLRLVQQARAIAPRVVVSIFVNPMQFAAGEDYERYPVTLEADRKALIDAGVDLLFAPTVAEVYPGGTGQATSVVVPGLNGVLEGAHRPSHFNGVTTVVAKLFNMVAPDIAVFGEKDFQQLLIVKRMVRDLDMPVRIEAVETVREHDGLAMSSRNGYLDEQERALAAQIYQELLDVKAVVEAGETDYENIGLVAARQLAEAGLAVDYVSLCRQADLEPARAGDRQLMALAAACVGTTRLIDNIKISIT